LLRAGVSGLKLVSFGVGLTLVVLGGGLVGASVFGIAPTAGASASVALVGSALMTMGVALMTAPFI
jgi:hypothetical protein